MQVLLGHDKYAWQYMLHLSIHDLMVWITLFTLYLSFSKHMGPKCESGSCTGRLLIGAQALIAKKEGKEALTMLSAFILIACSCG